MEQSTGSDFGGIRTSALTFTQKADLGNLLHLNNQRIQFRGGSIDACAGHHPLLVHFLSQGPPK